MDDIAMKAGDHAVQFYECESDLYRTVGAHMAQFRRRGGTAIVIATEAHRQAFLAELGDGETVVADGSVIALDAAATLSQMTVDNRIDRAVFEQLLVPILRDAAGRGGPVFVYGEMVALLWEAGKVLGAIALEELWNDVQRELPFALLCGYPSSAVAGPAHADERKHMCDLHTSVRQPAVVATRRFSAESSSPRAARGFVAQTLRACGYDAALVEDAELVASELATNAVVHARSPFKLVARSGGGVVRLSVEDASAMQPFLRPLKLDGTSGRGLHVISMLARDWGVEQTSGGKSVWAELQG